METQKKVVIIGATSMMATHCARLWLAEPNTKFELILVGRQIEKLKRLGADLQVRKPSALIELLTIDFLNPDAIDTLARDILMKGPVDIVLIAQGVLSDQRVCQEDLKACQQSLEINALSPVFFAEAFAKYMSKENKGTIAVISSVAGDRGRKSNYIYGAAKGLVNRYVQGLQHRFAGQGLHILLIKPGPTDTPMTASLKEKRIKLASVETVARAIVSAIKTKKTCLYTPSQWKWIMLIIQHLPAFIFNKMDI